MADATMIIDSKLATKDLERQLRAQEKELAKTQKELDQITHKADEVYAKYEEITAAARETAEAIKGASASGGALDAADLEGAVTGYEAVRAEMEQLSAQEDALRLKYEEQRAAVEMTRAELAAANEEAIARKAQEAEATGQAAQAEREEEQATRETTEAMREQGQVGTDAEERIAQQTEETTEKIRESGEASREMGTTLNTSLAGTKKGFSLASTALGKFTKRIIGLAKRVFIFSVITSALRSVRDWISNTAAESEEFSAALAGLKAQLASAFQPILNAIVPALTTLVNALSTGIAYVQAFIRALTGLGGGSGSSGQNSAAGRAQTQLQGMVTTSTKLSGSTSASTKALGQEGAALKATGSAADKASKALANFDEINQLTFDNGASGGSGGGGGSGISVDTPVVAIDPATLELPAWMQGILDALENIKRGFQEAFQADPEQLKANIGSIITTLREVWEDPEVVAARSRFMTSAEEALGAVAGMAASVATSFAVGVTGGIDAATKSLKEFNKVKLTSIFNNLTRMNETTTALSGAIATIGTAFEGEGFQKISEFFATLADILTMEFLDKVTGLASDFYNMFAQPIIDNADEFKRLLENIYTIIGNLLEPVTNLLDKIADDSKAYEDTWIHKFLTQIAQKNSERTGKTLRGINSALEDFIELLESDTKLPTWLTDIYETVQNGWGEAVDYLTDLWVRLTGKSDDTGEKMTSGWSQTWKSISAGITTAWNSITGFFSQTWQSISSGVQSAWNGIKNFFFGVTTSISTSIQSAWRGVATFFSGLWGTISSGAQNAWNGLSSFFSGIGTSIKNNLVNAFNAVANFLTGLWRNIASAASSGWNTIWAYIKAPLNGIISSVEAFANRIINGLNNLLKKVSGVANSIGSKLGISFNVGQLSPISIPRLAEGAVIPGGSQFLAVLGDQPSGQTNIETPLDTMVQAFRQALSEMGTNQTIVMEVDRQQLAKITYNLFQQENRRVGSNLVGVKL